MLRRTAAALAALLILTGCEGDDPPQQLEPTALRVIAGDRQVGVLGEETSALRAQLGIPGVLPDTLVVQIEGDTVTVSSLLLGPAVVADTPELPAGTEIAWTPLYDGCGAPFMGGSLEPDSLLQGRNLWQIPGSQANLTGVLPAELLGWHEVEGEQVWSAACPMEVRLREGAEFTVADTAYAYFEPGPAASLTVPERQILWLGETLRLRDLSAAAADGFGNALPPQWIVWDADTLYSVPGEGWDTVTASLDEASRQMQVVAMQPIGAGWTFNLRCEGGSIDGVVELDSLIVQSVVDSVVWDDNVTPDFVVDAWLYVTQSKTEYRAGGEVVHDDGVRGYYMEQRPGAIALTAGDAGAIGQSPLMVADSAVPQVYTAADGRCHTATTVLDELRAPGA